MEGLFSPAYRGREKCQVYVCVCVCVPVLAVSLVLMSYVLHLQHEPNFPMENQKLLTVQTLSQWQETNVLTYLLCVSVLLERLLVGTQCRESEPWFTLSVRRGTWNPSSKTKQHSNRASLLTGMSLLVWRNPLLHVYFCMCDRWQHRAHRANVQSYLLWKT